MANSLGIDPKKFKHVKSDDKSTTLQHIDGHILTIAHNALFKDSKAQLEALSKLPKEDETAEQSNEEKSQYGKVTRTDRPTKHGFAEGGAIAPNISDSDKQAMNNFVDTAPVTPEDKAKQFMAGAKDDPTLQNIVHGIAMGGIGSAEGAIAEEAAPALQNLGKVIVKEGVPEKIGKVIRTATPTKYGFAEGGSTTKSQYEQDENSPSVGRSTKGKPSTQEDIKATEQTPENGLNNLKNGLKELFGKAEGGEVEQPQAPQEDEGVAKHIGKLVGEYGINPIINSLKSLGHLGSEALESSGKFTQGLEAGVGAPGALTPVPEAPAQPQAQPAQVQASAPAEQPQAPAQPQQPDALDQSLNTSQDLMQKGYQSKLSGINQEAAAKGQEGTQQAQALANSEASQVNAKNLFQQHYNDLEAERQNHMQDIKDGYIDPNQYWHGDKNGNGGHSKIAAGIGMILAGFNPTSNPNAATNFLKFQMEQNIQSQAHNLAAKNNLLAANIQQFHNLKDATDMTRLMQSDIMQNELAQAAAKAQSPLAKAAALQAAGQLKMEFAPLQQQFALRKAMMQAANGGNGSPQDEGSYNHLLAYMRQTNPEMAKEMESRHVPGVGTGSVPVPNEVRGQLIAKQQFGQAVHDLRDWASQHSGSLDPKAIATGKTMAANVQNLYRQGINGGVFKQGEQSFINGIIDSDPTKFFNSIRVLPKLDEASRENENSLNVLKQGYGLPSRHSPQAPQIKIVNGVKYMRGPNGQAIPVK